jgi:hypothetical protein
MLLTLLAPSGAAPSITGSLAKTLDSVVLVATGSTPANITATLSRTLGAVQAASQTSINPAFKIKVAGSWLEAQAWIKVNGNWELAQPRYKVNGDWQ